jgi:hypothetical protein
LKCQNTRVPSLAKLFFHALCNVVIQTPCEFFLIIQKKDKLHDINVVHAYDIDVINTFCFELFEIGYVAGNMDIASFGECAWHLNLGYRPKVEKINFSLPVGIDIHMTSTSVLPGLTFEVDSSDAARECAVWLAELKSQDRRCHVFNTFRMQKLRTVQQFIKPARANQ